MTEQDNLELLINSIENSTVTPTAVEIEKHSRFLTWLTDDGDNIIHKINKYIEPTLEIALPIMTSGLVSKSTAEQFYKLKFVFDLYKKWEESHKTELDSKDDIK